MRSDLHTSRHNNEYPHPFGNYENELLDQICDADRLWEYPINIGYEFDDGADEGPDRVIFDGATGTFCGVVNPSGPRQ